jgi:hypothetical protein
LARRRLLLLQDGSGGKATAALALEVRHTHALPPRRCLRRWCGVRPGMAQAHPPRSKALAFGFDLACIHQKFTQNNDIGLFNAVLTP